MLKMRITPDDDLTESLTNDLEDRFVYKSFDPLPHGRGTVQVCWGGNGMTDDQPLIDPLLLELSTRLITCLDRHEIHALDDVVAMDLAELEDLEGVGSVLLDELTEHFERYGLEPGTSLPPGTLFPEGLDGLMRTVIGRHARWWTGRGVRMFRRFVPVSTTYNGERGQCVLDSGATKLTIELDATEETVACSCGHDPCSTHGMAAVLFLAKENRVQTLFDQSIFDRPSGPPDLCPMDPLLFLLPGNARNPLIDAGIEWVEELVQLTPSEMTDVRGIGPKRAEELVGFLNDLHLRPGDRPASADRGAGERISPALGGYVFHLLDTSLNPDLGIEHFQSDRVLSVQEDDGTYHATVNGRRDYDVTLTPSSGTCSCTCSMPEERAPCKHALATALEAARRERLQTLSDADTEGIGDDLIWMMKQMKDTAGDEPAPPECASCCYYLRRFEGGWCVRATPSPDVRPAGDGPGSGPGMTPDQVRDPRDRALLRRLNDRDQRGRSSRGEPPEVPGSLMALLSDREVYVETKPGTDREAVFPDENASPVLELVKTGSDQFALHLLFELNDRSMPAGAVEVLSEEPLWLLDGNRVFHVESPPFVSRMLDRSTEEELTFSADELTAFSEQVFPELLDRNVPVRMEDGLFDERDVQPEGRVYLRDRTDRLVVELRIAYGDVEFSRISGGRFPITDPDSGDLVGIRRDPDREEELLNRLRSFGLQSMSAGHPLRLEPDGDRGTWLLDVVPELPEHGFSVFGEEQVDSTPEVVAPDRSEARLAGGVSWFELGGQLSYGEESVTFADLLEALQDERSYVQLSDDRYGKLPESWIERFSDLAPDMTADGDKVRVPGLSLHEMEQLLEEMDDVETDRTVQRYRKFRRNFDGIESVDDPTGFKGTLRSYQRDGLAWLNCLRSYELGGLLADDMGLGKTVQVLAHLQYVREENGAFPDTLVVAPRSVLSNWQREAREFLPEPQTYVHHGPHRREQPPEWPMDHLALTTYGTLREDVDWLKEVPFDTVVLDECQAIRNPDTKTAGAVRLLDAEHRIGLSGTPVQNTVMDLWSQFQFLNPGLLGSRSAFEEQYAVPIEEREDEQRATELREKIEPFLLRRTKSKVEQQLPELSENRVDCPMEPAQEQLYDSVRKQFRRDVSEAIVKHGVEQSRMKVLEGLTRLRQICCHPALLEGTEMQASSKLDRFVEMARDLIGEGHRALVFSQFVEFLSLIERAVEREGWSYAYLDGSTNNREEVVDEFQSSEDLSLFLISLQAGGEGLNLTGADYVFLMDPWWNPAVERQAMDRTHRIGQDRPVFVYRFICPDTIEEKMLTLQENKRQMAGEVISSESGMLKEMDGDDMLELFS